MATIFLEPGGDADFSAAGSIDNFWSSSTSAVATDHVHGSHQKSIQHGAGSAKDVIQTNVMADSGRRISFYVYIVTLPSATSTLLSALTGSNASSGTLRVTSAGILQLWNGTTAQIGSNGPTLATGQWYRISMAYTITSTTVNRFEIFVGGVSAISVTNATLAAIGAINITIGNRSGNANFELRTSDHYIDDSASLTDTGDIWVTAKRPVSNGSTNGLTTQIGSGGSGYGSGHSPQINERPASTTNGWSLVTSGSSVTEEYNIEAKSVGDFDLTNATIVDSMGWVSVGTSVQVTGNVVLGGSTFSKTFPSPITMSRQAAGSATYPPGTGSDIGIQTGTSPSTFSLYECGVLVAFIPGATVRNSGFLQFM